MDNLTHTLTALMLSRAGLNRWCPKATPLLVLAANAPDIDVIASLWGALSYLDHHRGITHALVAAPGIALIAALLVRVSGPLPLIRALVVGFIGAVSHLLLDWTNTYGIRMLLPVSNDWLRLDITNVIDLIVWAVLLLAVAGPVLSKLVSAEIGAKPGTGQGSAIFALLFIAAYSGGRWVMHERALNLLNSHIYEGAAPHRVAAFPHYANPFQWIGLVEGRGFVSTFRVNLLLTFDATGGHKYYELEPGPLLDAARETDTFRRYLSFAQFPFWRLTPLDSPEGGAKVEVMDLRFGDPDAPRFLATAVLDRGRRVLEHGFSFGPLRPR